MDGNTIQSNGLTTLAPTIINPPGTDVRLSEEELKTSTGEGVTGKPQDQAPIVLEHAKLEASYEFDRQIRQIIIKLKRPEDGEVIRQLPPEQVVKMLQDVMSTFEKELDAKG